MPFDMGTPSEKPAEPAEDIPDFLRAAGWGQSTGSFDESKPIFAGEEPAAPAQPIEQGDLPDWVKAMAPPPPAETPQQSQEPEEEMPDWINKIGTSALPISSESTDQPDWLKQTEPPAAQPAEEQPDWLKQPDSAGQPVASSDDQPDWLKGFESEANSGVSKPSTGELDWLSQLGQEAKPAESSADEFDFLNQPAGEPQSSAATDFDFLKELGNQPETKSAAPAGEDFDFLNELSQETEQLAPTSASGPEPAVPSMKDNLGMSEAERDDSFAWLEGLAAKQGATEGLLTTPEERLEQEPDWVKQAKGTDVGQPPVTQPTGNLEELGKTEQEQDDSFAWLENLAAKQGATEGLLTTPEQRLEEEPEWVKQAKDLNAEKLSAPEQVPSMDDTAMWLRSLDDKDAAEAEPVESKDDTAIWFKRLEESEETPSQPAESVPAEDLPAWMQNLEEEKSSETQFNIPINEIESSTAAKEAAEMPEASDWMSTIEQESTPESVAPAEEKTSELPESEIPSWLGELDREEEQAVTPTSMDADLPAWLRDETGELVAEPTKIEPTRATDWQPVEKQPEPEPVMREPEVQAPQPEPEPILSQAEIQPPQPEPVSVVNIIEERIAAVQEPAPPVEPPKPVKPKGTGKLSMPMDPVLGQARNELAGNNLNNALESYNRLIKKGRFLDEVIFDLRDALYRFPVDVNVWQSLGDAYMRANRLQDALDSYTKAEELLR